MRSFAQFIFDSENAKIVGVEHRQDGRAYQFFRCSIWTEDADGYPLNPTSPKWLRTADGWVFHGTTLSIAQRILTKGMVAGPATHYFNGRSLQGFFVITGPNIADCLMEARDRCKCPRCPEWKKYGVPSAWSVPCVVAFRSQVIQPLVHYQPIGPNHSRKSCFECPPGTVLGRNQILANHAQLYVVEEEYNNFLWLHQYTHAKPNPVLAMNDLMMCGGKEEFDGWTLTWYASPLAWSEEPRQMYASCGRVVPFNSLPTEGWIRTPKKKYWFCRACYYRNFARHNNRRVEA